MESDTLKTPDTEGRKPVLVLQPAELPLEGGAARVEVAEAARLARDQGVAPLGLGPAGGGLALARGDSVSLDPLVDARAAPGDEALVREPEAGEGESGADRGGDEDHQAGGGELEEPA